MSNPLTIQLPPNLELFMLQEAQKQNTTLENLALKSLQKDYGVNQSNYPNLTPSIVDFFIALRDGMKAGHPTVQTLVDESNIQIAESLKRTGVLSDFQVAGQQLILSINPHPPKHPLAEIPLDLDPSVVGSELAEIAKKLKHDNPETRMQAIHDLVAWHEQQA